MTEEQRSIWAGGAAYDRFMGRWSRLVAEAFVAWLAAPARARWLDVGCGTGAVTQTIDNRAAPERIIGLDPSAEQVLQARAQTGSDRVHFLVGDILATPWPRHWFDVVVSGLVLNFVPDPLATLVAMAGNGRPGATVAAYVWDYGDRMDFLRYFWQAAVDLDPGAAALDEGAVFPICRPDRLAAVFAAAGLQAVSVRAIDVPTVFADFNDFWEPFLGGRGPAGAYVRSLSDDARVALRGHLTGRLPIRPDGSIHLLARAWAVRAFQGD